MNLVVVGHKDHGKSTMIGRLLHDSKAVPEHKLEEIKKELKQSGNKNFKFAFLLDSLEEERKGGLTMDIMQTPFKSSKYNYTIIDCPGHREFIKNMLTGASQADAAVLVVSAKEGIQDQTKQHAFLIKTLGITQLVVAVNKMDAVNYSQDSYEQTCSKLKKILLSLGYKNTITVPVSAMKGDNVFMKSNTIKWYNGPTLIDALDGTISPSTLPSNKPLRCFVQDTYELETGKIIICKVESGILKTGETICFCPSEKHGLVQKIEKYGSNVKRAEPGDSVGIQVKGVTSVKRGEVITYSSQKIKPVQSFISEVILFTETELKAGVVTIIRCGTAQQKCKVERILNEIDPVRLDVLAISPKSLNGGSVGEVEFSPLNAFCIEKHADSPSLGRFVIEGKKGPIGAGIVLKVKPYA